MVKDRAALINGWLQRINRGDALAATHHSKALYKEALCAKLEEHAATSSEPFVLHAAGVSVPWFAKTVMKEISQEYGVNAQWQQGRMSWIISPESSQ